MSKKTEKTSTLKKVATTKTAVEVKEKITAEVAPTNEQQIKALQRKVANFEERVSRETQKNQEWREEDKRLIDVENEKYEKRKIQLSEDLEKLEKRHDKRLKSIDKWWGAYALNHSEKKIEPMQEQLDKYHAQLSKLQKESKTK